MNNLFTVKTRNIKCQGFILGGGLQGELCGPSLAVLNVSSIPVLKDHYWCAQGLYAVPESKLFSHMQGKCLNLVSSLSSFQVS